MSKKELRKELELTLVKTIEEVLNKQNTVATSKIRKTTHEASKMVAKKFLKIIKSIAEIKIVTPPKTVKKALLPIKKVVVKAPKIPLAKGKKVSI